MTNLVVTIGLLCWLGTAAASGDLELLPPDGFGEGWHKSGVVRVFAGADLYGYINGGSELFLESGFERLTVQRYALGPDEISVEIYRMTDPVAGTVIYLSKCGVESPDAHFPERHTVNRYQLMFLRDRYYVTLNNHEGREERLPDLLRFGAHIAARLPKSVPVVADLPLPKEGLVPNSVRLIRGPYALQAVYTLGEGDILSLAGRITAVSGEYRVSEGRGWTMIVADYPDEQQARRALAHLRKHLDPYLTPIERSDTRLVFRDYAQAYGVISRQRNRLEIRVHLSERPE